MKIGYYGYYGAKNSGDDAFVEVAAWGAQKYWGCTEHVFFSEELPQITTSASSLNYHKGYFSFAKAIYSIFETDIFISAGGSTFHSELKSTDLRTYAKLKKRLFKNSIAGAIGISLGPYSNAKAEESTIAYLKKLNFLSLRDKYSYDLACSYNLPYKPVEAFDLAALLPSIYSDIPNRAALEVTNEEKIIGISICNYERYLNGDLEKEKRRNKYFLEVLIPFVKEKNIKFRFFVFNGNPQYGDLEVTTNLIHQMQMDGLNNFEVIPYLNNVELTWNKIKECDLIISTRLHASIFACFADVPFFLIEYHRKCSDFLNDVGHQSAYRLLDGERNVKEVWSEIRKILFDKKYIYPLNKSASEDRALLNFTETYPLCEN